MRFRTAVLLGTLALVAAVLVATVSAVAVVLERAAREDLGRDLVRGRRAFSDLRALERGTLRDEVRVVADEPRLKAVVDTHDVNAETVLGVAQDLSRAAGSDLFVLTDGNGRVVADTAHPGGDRGDTGRLPFVDSAIEGGGGSGVLVRDHRAFEVEARRIAFGDVVVGVLAIGRAVDDRAAESLYRYTSDSIVILLDGTPIAASPLEGETRPAPGSLAALAPIAGAETEAQGVREVTLDGTRYLALAAAYPGPGAPTALRYVLLRSLDRALEPARRLAILLYGIALAALLASVVLALVLSRRLSRPIDALVAFAGRIAGGTLAPSATTGPREIRSLGDAMNEMVVELLRSRALLAEQARMKKELEIAERIQTSILPHPQPIGGLELAAHMVPATEVGGDYYDVMVRSDGAWIGIGDVAGHGLTAGLVMLMVQTAIATLVTERPEASPREILRVVNAVLYENIRQRLFQDEHVTLTLLRYHGDGRVAFAGAHEEIVVCRADTGRCERIATPGTWLGAMFDIDRFTVDTELVLRPGDLLVLYSDGILQTMNVAGEQFGIERLCAAVERLRVLSAERIVETLLAESSRFGAEQLDDVTVVVARYLGEAEV